MSTIRGCAQAFLKGKSASCHNAATDGKRYMLHGHTIAEKYDHAISFNWCGWYTVTTANHMNTILKEMDADFRVSYSRDRNLGIVTFDVPRT